MSSLYQYFANDINNYKALNNKSSVNGSRKVMEDDDDATPTTGNNHSQQYHHQHHNGNKSKKQRHRTTSPVIVDMGISPDDKWIGSELHVTQTDSTISQEEITLDGRSGSGSGTDDMSSIDIGVVSSNDDLESTSSDSTISYEVKYNNYSRRSPRKTEETEMTEVKDLGFFTLGISRRPEAVTHRSYVQLSTPESDRSAPVSPIPEPTETSSEPDRPTDCIWSNDNDSEKMGKHVKEPEAQETSKRRKLIMILVLAIVLAVAAVAVVVGVTVAGKKDDGNGSSVSSLSAPHPTTSSPSASPTVSPLHSPSTKSSQQPNFPATNRPSPSPSKTTTARPTVSKTLRPSVPPPTLAPTVSLTAPPSSTSAAPPTTTAPPSSTTTAPPSASPTPASTQAPSVTLTAPPSKAPTPAPSISTAPPTTIPPTQVPSSKLSPTLNPTSNPLANDQCNGSFGPLQPNGTVELGTTTGSSSRIATTCGDSISASGVWYTVIGTGDTFNASTCNENTNFHTRLLIYTGSCNTLSCVGSNYNGFKSGTCQDGSSTVSWQSQPKVLYFIFLYGDSNTTGNFGLTIESSSTSDFASCNNTTTMLPSDGSVTLGSTTGASLISAATCGTTKAGYGVWYFVNGTGGLITADTCGGDTTLDTTISIFTGTCNSLVCVAGNDDTCGQQSSVSWTSVAGQLYHILVLTISETGYFSLTVQ